MDDDANRSETRGAKVFGSGTLFRSVDNEDDAADALPRGARLLLVDRKAPVEATPVSCIIAVNEDEARASEAWRVKQLLYSRGGLFRRTGRRGQAERRAQWLPFLYSEQCVSLVHARARS